MKKSFLKSKTVHGLKTGNHSNPNVLRAARASGGSCMVEGASARPSMSKPKMMRADGGPTISEDSKEKAAKLRESAKSDENWAKAHLGVGAANLGVSALAAKRAPGAAWGNLAGGAWNASQMKKSGAAMNAKRAEADSIERGEAIPGKEDKYKNGGGIMPRFKAKKTDKDDC